MAALYDAIGTTYASTRRQDPRIATAINRALEGCRSVLNVGAGTGSYEPTSGRVVAVEPAWTMISQRAATTAPVIQARAEQLPFADGSLDAVLGVLTLHHWADLARGLAECQRVAADRVVFFTVDVDVGARFWLFEYFPEIAAIDRQIFPSMESLSRHLGEITVTPVPIPADCLDGFGGAYWKRPAAFLDPAVRAGMSTFSRIANFERGLQRLQEDLRSDAWIERYPDLRTLDELDLGYRIVAARGGARRSTASTSVAGATAASRVRDAAAGRRNEQGGGPWRVADCDGSAKQERGPLAAQEVVE